MLFADLGCYGGYYKDYYGDYCGGSYKGYRWVRILFINLAYYTSYLGVVGVRGDVLVLK